MPNGHIDIHPGRKQPYTVWVNGQVVKFTADPAEANEALHRGLARAG